MDFVTIAKGFGIRAEKLATGTNPYRAMAMAFAHRGPCLIHAAVDADEMVYPMVPPGAANREMIRDYAGRRRVA
jgi:acetolactate synthase-1/2/3 large subunit